VEYLKLQQKDTGDIHWIRASMHVRGVLVTMLLRCSAVENGGLIAGCRDWSDGDWQFGYGVPLQDVQALVEARLAQWVNDDLILSLYDRVGQERLQLQRSMGPHGAKGGRNPKGNPRGSAENNPKGNPKGSPHTTPHQCREAAPKGSVLYGPLGLVAHGPEKKQPMDLKALMANREKQA
jgi:hypothetical protein